MKLTKIAFAVASVLSMAAANAGQIDSSSATLATEVIVNDAQIVRAPSKTYAFAGDIDARTNEQRLQLQYTLSKGTWAVGAGTEFAAVNTLTLMAIDKLITMTATDAANNAVANMAAVGSGAAFNPVVNAFVTADKKTLVLNITIPAEAEPKHYLKNPKFTVNALDLGATDNVGVNGLFTVAGAVACPAPDASVDINFKHFTNHNGNTDVLSVASPDSEHLRVGSTNDARLFNFTQNLTFSFTPAANASRTDATFLNNRLSGNNFTTIAANQPLGGAAAAPVTRHFMGSVKTNLRSNGLDLDYVHTYGNADATAGFAVADFDVANDDGDKIAGEIEMKEFTVDVTIPAAWPAGTIVHLSAPTGGAAIGTAVTTTAGQTAVKFTITSAANAAALAAGANLWADFPGNALIPQTSNVPTVVTLSKDSVLVAPDRREQTNVCSGTLTGIGGGIKIDVRNYAAYATFGATGPATTVRIINNSEGTNADVYGQMIYADGTYGPSGKLADLKPREVVNLSNKAIEALLTTAPAAANPFGTSTVYTSKAGTAVVGSTKAGISDRLRIVSNTGSTLRVQSYMVVGNSVIDTSNAQGVDFENSGDRIPTNGLDAQPISQDAINGLSK